MIKSVIMPTTGPMRAISLASGFFAISIQQIETLLLYSLKIHATIIIMNAIPALLTNSEEEFIKQIIELSAYFDYFQIDITDGKFVPSTTLTIEQLRHALSQIDSKLLQRLTFDFDLMTFDYTDVINTLLKMQNSIKINNVFIHASALKSQPLPILTDFFIGIALDPTDQIEAIDRQYDVKSIPCIQIMTVTPGFQGSPFREEELNKIDQLRKMSYESNIYLDGGVNDTTIPIILSHENRPNYLGIGSFLSKAPDIKQRVQYLNNML